MDFPRIKIRLLTELSKHRKESKGHMKINDLVATLSSDCRYCTELEKILQDLISKCFIWAGRSGAKIMYAAITPLGEQYLEALLDKIIFGDNSVG